MKSYYYLIFIIGYSFTCSANPPIHYDYCESEKHKAVYIFSWSNYDNFEKLNSPHFDSDSIAKILKKEYNFNFSQFKELTKEEVINKLHSILRTDINSPKIFYFIGLGKYDTLFSRGYLLCKDAKKDDTYQKSYLSLDHLKTIFKHSPNRKTLLITDIDFDLSLNSFNPFKPMEYKRNTDSSFLKVKYKLDTCHRLVSPISCLWLSYGNTAYRLDADSVNKLSPFAETLAENLIKKDIFNVQELFENMLKSNKKTHLENIGIYSTNNFNLK